MLASDTREIEVILDPSRMLGREADGGRRRGGAEGHESAAAGRPLSRRTACSIWCSRPALWKSIDDIADTPVVVKGGATLRVRDLGVVRNGAPDRTSLIVGQGGNATAISVSQQVGANILSVRAGSGGRAHAAQDRACPPGCSS